MKKPPLSALFGVALLASITSAQAATRILYINGSDLIAGSGASASLFGIELPDFGTPAAIINLSLPQDYKKDSPVILQTRLGGGGISCNVTLKAMAAYRARPGVKVSLVLGSTSGFTIVSPGTFATPSVNSKIFTKDFKLKPATAGPVLGQRAGDNVIAVIMRNGATPGDTCTNSLTVVSIKMIYTTP